MYEDYCAGCHKANGLGKFVMGIPATFSNQLSREEIIKLILKGDPRYPRMPTFPQIRFSQADKIAQYLSQLEQEQQ
ncbi:cytochrome c [Oceanospirillum sp. HFRX-1_2]